MDFLKDRQDAGAQLSLLLTKYLGKDVVVYAIPRGGVVVAEPIADFLNVPMDLILAHKIGHPFHAEYAIAAVSESGHIIGSSRDLHSIDEKWLDREKERQMNEIKRKREKYLKEFAPISLKDKIAIIVDDGIATGLTMQVGILELRDFAPKKIVAVVPVSPRSTAELLKTMVDDFVALQVPEDYEYRGAVGAYYEEFNQVEDETVIAILRRHAQKIAKSTTMKSSK